MKSILKEVLVNLITEAGKTLSCILLALVLHQVHHIDQICTDPESGSITTYI